MKISPLEAGPCDQDATDSSSGNNGTSNYNSNNKENNRNNKYNDNIIVIIIIIIMIIRIIAASAGFSYHGNLISSRKLVEGFEGEDSLMRVKVGGIKLINLMPPP